MVYISHSEKLAVIFSRLLFIVQRMDVILSDLSQCLKDKDMSLKLEYMDCGQNCLLSIVKHVK